MSEKGPGKYGLNALEWLILAVLVAFFAWQFLRT